MLLNNLITLGLLFLAWSYIFKFLLRNNKLLSKTIRVFLLLHVILVAFIITEQHRFSGNLANSLFIDDGELNSANAWQISTALTGVIPDIDYVSQMRGIHFADRGWGLKRYYNDYIKKKIIPLASDYHIRYITYLYSIIYASYGFTPAIINFMNVILHLITVILIYKSVTLAFDGRTAYLSAVLFLVNPITFYYSSTKLQESASMFLTYLSVFCYIAFLKKNNYWYAISIFPIFYIISSFLRSYYLMPLLLVFVVTSIIVVFLKNKRIFFIFFVCAAFSLPILHYRMPRKIESYARQALQDCVTHQKGFYSTGGQIYKIFLTDKESWNYTLKDWAGYTLRGWYHMLNEPVLSADRSIKLLLFFPVKVIFLILCAFAVPGILMAVRCGNAEAVIFISILAILGTGIALSSGNVGTMLRHRDVITPAVFIFSAFFITRARYGQSINNLRKE